MSNGTDGSEEISNKHTGLALLRFNESISGGAAKQPNVGVEVGIVLRHWGTVGERPSAVFERTISLDPAAGHELGLEKRFESLSVGCLDSNDLAILVVCADSVFFEDLELNNRAARRDVGGRNFVIVVFIVVFIGCFVGGRLCTGRAATTTAAAAPSTRGAARCNGNVAIGRSRHDVYCIEEKTEREQNI